MKMASATVEMMSASELRNWRNIGAFFGSGMRPRYFMVITRMSTQEPRWEDLATIEPDAVQIDPKMARTANRLRSRKKLLEGSGLRFSYGINQLLSNATNMGLAHVSIRVRYAHQGGSIT